jgi:hypothetical protein
VLSTHNEVIRDLTQQSLDPIARNRKEVAIGDAIERDAERRESVGARPVNFTQSVLLGFIEPGGQPVASRAELLEVAHAGRATSLHACGDVVGEEAAQPECVLAQMDAQHEGPRPGRRIAGRDEVDEVIERFRLIGRIGGRNSSKRASMSARFRVRKRSTPKRSQQKLPMTEP